MEIIYCLSLSFIVYTYFGYPVFLYVWSKILSRDIKKGNLEYKPSVSVIIAARNEENNIGIRIKNLIAQDYPENKLEIIIISDGSSDRTNTIVEQLSNEFNDRTDKRDNLVNLISYAPSRGKPYAINMGVAKAKGEIIVFADCRQRFAKNAVTELVANFNDEGIGCVSGELVFEESHGSSIEKEMGMYWKFEKKIRKLESETGSVPGATGAIYAIRKNLFSSIPEQTLLDDVLIPLNVRMLGYRVIFDSKALAYDSVSKDISLEKQRKVRTLAGNWQLLYLRSGLLSPINNPLWTKFISHKIFRLLVPYFVILLFVSTLYLQDVKSFMVMGLMLFVVSMVFIPDHFGVLGKLSRISRTVVFLNYFALIAPLKLIFSRRQLW